MGLAAGNRLLDEQGTDAAKGPVGADQRAAAPKRMRRRGEDGFVKQVFPITGEFPDGYDLGVQGLGLAAGAGQNHRIAFVKVAGTPDFHRRPAAGFQGLNQTEPGFLVIAHDMAGEGAAG